MVGGASVIVVRRRYPRSRIVLSVGTNPHLGPALAQAWRVVWRASRRVFLLSLAAEILGAAGLAAVLLFGREVVGALTGSPPVTELGDVLADTLGLGVGLAVSGVAAVVVRDTRWLVSEHVTRHVQEEIIGISSSVDFEQYERQEFHDLLNRANARASESSYQLVYDVLSLANVAVTSIVVVGVLVTSVPEVLGVLVLIALPSVAAARASARLAFQATYALTPTDRLRHYLYRALTAKTEAREVRVFGLAVLLRDRWSQVYDDRMRRIGSLVRRQVLFNGIAALIGAALVAGVLLLLVNAAIDGSIGLDDAAIAIVALQQLTSRVRTAASASGSLRQGTLFLADFDQFRRLAEATEEPQATGPLRRGALVVDRVSFRYPGTDATVLRNVWLEIAPGEIVALVGLSGSGKTTLAHIVAGLYPPTSGRITYDGVDIADIPRGEYWRSVAAVFQDFVRYELTARENVAMSDYERIGDEPAVDAAARRAGIDEALLRLARGYDTMMSRAYDDGADLSVGQWQRVALARAFFREAPLLVLDEPAAALDAIAEKRLYERLVELCESRSVLLISHRFSTVRLAHRICVMHEGRIVEEGTHQELMELGGRYAELFRVQASGYLDSA
jgi:ATP-binding cassette, subfamily B, bacterial